jgi:drug/metabolite transporter (DMT)-like permease
VRGRTVVAFATIYLVWGSTYLAIAYAVASIPPLLMMGVRSLLAGAVLYGWTRVAGAARPTRASWRAATIAGAFLFLGSHGLLAWAEQRVASGLAALVVATGTFWMLGAEWVRPGGRRPAGSAVAGAALGLSGVFLLLGSGSGGVDVIGAVALMLSALLWAAGSVYARGSALPRSPQLASALPLLTGGMMLVATSLVTGEARELDLRAIDARAVFALLYLIVFGSIVAFSAYEWLLRTTSPVRVSTHVFVNPVIAVLLGWALAGETVTPRVLLAGAIIIASIVLIHGTGPGRRGASRPERARTTAPVGGMRVRGGAAA